MTINRPLRKTSSYLGTITLGTALGFLGAAGLYLYPHHNTHYQEEGNEIFEKVDGLFSYTKVTIYASGPISVGRISRDGVRLYIDQEWDGILDIVRVPEVPINLYRKSDLDSYRPTFNKADMDFQEQLRRFSPLESFE